MYSLITNPLSHAKIRTTSREGRELVKKYAASSYITNQLAGAKLTEPQSSEGQSFYTAEGRHIKHEKCMSKEDIYTVTTCTVPIDSVQIDGPYNYAGKIQTIKTDVNKILNLINKATSGQVEDNWFFKKYTNTQRNLFIKNRNDLYSSDISKVLSALNYFKDTELDLTTLDDNEEWADKTTSKIESVLQQINNFKSKCATGAVSKLYQMAGGCVRESLTKEDTPANDPVFEDETLYDTLTRIVGSSKETDDIDALQIVQQNLKKHIHYIHGLFQQVVATEQENAVDISGHNASVNQLRLSITDRNIKDFFKGQSPAHTSTKFLSAARANYPVSGVEAALKRKVAIAKKNFDVHKSASGAARELVRKLTEEQMVLPIPINTLRLSDNPKRRRIKQKTFAKQTDAQEFATAQVDMATLKTKSADTQFENATNALHVALREAYAVSQVRDKMTQLRKLAKNYETNNMILAKYIINSNSSYTLDTTASILKYCGELAPLYKVLDVEFYIKVLNSRPTGSGVGIGEPTIEPTIISALQLLEPPWSLNFAEKIIIQLNIQHLYTVGLNDAFDNIQNQIKNKKLRLLEQTKTYSTRVKQFTKICADIQKIRDYSQASVHTYDGQGDESEAMGNDDGDEFETIDNDDLPRRLPTYDDDDSDSDSDSSLPSSLSIGTH